MKLLKGPRVHNYVIILWLGIMHGALTLSQAQDKIWLEGTWIGISYDPSGKFSRPLIARFDFQKDDFLLEFPETFCQVRWHLNTLDAHKAQFKQGRDIASSCWASHPCHATFTQVDSSHVSYSRFSSETGILESYATLVKVDHSQLSLIPNITMENNACENLFLDLDEGTLNGLKASANPQDVKQALPCFTGQTPDGAEVNCGGGVFYLNHDFYFYSGDNYIEVRDNFSGRISFDLLQKRTSEVIFVLGEPTREEEIVKWDGTYRKHFFYERKYGTLSLVFVENKLQKIAIHQTDYTSTRLCY